MSRGLIDRTLDKIATDMYEKKLLWTNPSPSSSFASQTVPLDLSNYDAVEVEAHLYAGHQTVITGCATVGGDASAIEAFLGRNGINSSTNNFDGQIYFSSRRFQATQNSVGFSAGAYALINANWTIDNTQMIPCKIYGIKY